MIVDRLLNAQGNARHILGLPKDGAIEWSNRMELQRFEVVRGIQFETFHISHSEVGIDFVECDFRRCTFNDLKVYGHLWGARDRWMDCVFERCNLSQMIAPVNSFKGCHFDQVEIESFKSHQTLFEDCTFSRSTIRSIKAHLITNSQIANPDLGRGEQLVFRNCRFKDISFRECYFEGVVFQRCSIEDTQADGCNFDGIISDFTWWSVQRSDPFTAFLTQALELIRTKCGEDSAAYREFHAYVLEYRSGQTRSQDFSACLYSKRVPYAETAKLSNGLLKLADRFPF